MNGLDEHLLHRAHADLTNRGRGGIVIYLLVWLSVTLPTGIYHQNPSFFRVNLAILLVLCLLRLGHLYCHLRVPDFPVPRAKRWLVFTILAAALHWGLMNAWVVLDDSLAGIREYVIISTAVFGISGATTLAISNRIRLYFPVFLIMPGVLAMLVRAETEGLILSIMALLALGYVMLTSKTANQDYWQAITNGALAEQRALEMERLSTTDALTGLNNRSYFDQRLLEDWALHARLKMPLGLLMVDIDHFKALNDSHGHQFGDYCLQQVSRVLRQHLWRDADTVARYGGEEFVVILPNTDEHGAAQVGERLRRALAETPIKQRDLETTLTCSIGGATFHPDRAGDDPVQLISRADEALYVAKASGRNRFRASAGMPLGATG